MSDNERCFFPTVRKLYRLLILFTQLIFKCVINNRDEVVEIKEVATTLTIASGYWSYKISGESKVMFKRYPTIRLHIRNLHIQLIICKR